MDIAIIDNVPYKIVSEYEDFLFIGVPTCGLRVGKDQCEIMRNVKKFSLDHTIYSEAGNMIMGSKITEEMK